MVMEGLSGGAKKLKLKILLPSMNIKSTRYVVQVYKMQILEFSSRSNTHTTFIARRILVHFLPLNKNFLDVFEYVFPVWLGSFLFSSALKKYKEVDIASYDH